MPLVMGGHKQASGYYELRAEYSLQKLGAPITLKFPLYNDTFAKMKINPFWQVFQTVSDWLTYSEKGYFELKSKLAKVLSAEYIK